MGKRIALFLGELHMDYQSKLFLGISRMAERTGTRVDIFTNFGVYAGNYLHLMGELNVANIPDYTLYDGILIAPDTLTVDGMYDNVESKVLKYAKCPVLSIRTEKEKFYNLLIDDRTSMEAIVEHFIVAHGFTKICYMSGRADMLDAQNRLKGYLNVMEKYNLEVTDDMIFQGNYWVDMAEEAVDFFTKDGKVPEAIVCANDYMAISIYTEFRKRGYKVPGDIAISGVDNIEEGHFFNPKLATADIPAEKMGEEAVRIILDIISGNKEIQKNSFLNAKLQMSGSCGCEAALPTDYVESIYSNYSFLKESINQSLQQNADFENCDTFEDVLRAAFQYSRGFGYKRIYICLCVEDESDESGDMGDYTPRMRLSAIFEKPDRYERLDEVFKRTDVLPEKYRKNARTIAVFPLHFRGHCMGYFVAEIENPVKLTDGFVLWANGLSNYLDKMNMYERNKQLLKYREESHYDGLTGIYNRRGMDIVLQKAIEQASESALYIISLDMDGLKHINDTFGHSEGDVAIKSLGSFLSSVANASVSCARMGGDEFMLSVQGTENDVKRVCQSIRKKIQRWNERTKKEYEISVSIGYEKYNPDEGLTACINKADATMYKEKQGKKNSRK